MEKRISFSVKFLKNVIKPAILLFLGLPSIGICGDSTVTTNMFKGNPLHTGYYGDQKAINNPKTKWMFKTEGRIFSSPIIDGNSIFFGCTDSCLYSIDKLDGKLLWKYRTEGIVKSTPLIFEEIVYFISMDGNFYALNSNDGSLIWTFRTEGEKLFAKMGFSSAHKDQLRTDVWDYFLSSAVTDGKYVYFGCGDGNLYALDRFNGNKVWSFKTGDVVHTSPALYKGNIYFGSMDHFFYALDSQTGNLLWKYATGTDPNYWVMTGIVSSAVVADDVVYFGCRDANLYALDANTGTKKWVYSNNGSWVLASPSVYNGNIYFGTSDTKKFNSVKLTTGKPNYSVTLNGYLFSSPAISGQMIYFGCYNGTLYACDINTGKAKWIFKTEANKQDPLHILNSTGGLMDIWDDTSDSTMIACSERLYSVGPIVSSPIVDDSGDVYFGSTDGCLYALTDDGTTEVKTGSSVKLNFKLEQNFPNPFNPSTVISFRLSVFSHVTLKVYDVLGNVIATLVNEEKAPGDYEISFDANKYSLSSGIYFYSLRAGGFTSTKKLVLTK